MQAARVPAGEAVQQRLKGSEHVPPCATAKRAKTIKCAI